MFPSRIIRPQAFCETVFRPLCATLNPMNRARAAATLAIRGLSWLLVLLVVMASVDRLPDPPAARSNYTQFQISSSHEKPASLATPCPLPVALIQPSLEGFTSLPAARVSHSGRSILLRRASDSSPPVLHLNLHFRAI